jgi:hypothetical protein
LTARLGEGICFREIQKIKPNDLIWDGEQWVSHAGVSANGLKSVMRIGELNIESTPDHLFLTHRGWKTAIEVETEKDTKLLQSEQDLEGESSRVVSLKKVSSVMSLCAVYVETKRLLELIVSGTAKKGYVEAVKILFPQELIQNPTLAATWWVTEGLESVGTSAITMPKNAVKIRKTKIGKIMGVVESKSSSTALEISWNILLRWIGLTSGDSRSTGSILMGTMSVETYELLANQLTMRTEEVYDILNCGPNNRYRIKFGIAHNCGYGMGADKFKDQTFKTCLKITPKIYDGFVNSTISIDGVTRHILS